ncbi:MAG: hypothetical protein EA352_05345 [Gemmatimonadales bacterium]|nr:MAG: hypothetical protein EA352_05345 [Gemmatimonadales bacterium]
MDASKESRADTELRAGTAGRTHLRAARGLSGAVVAATLACIVLVAAVAPQPPMDARDYYPTEPGDTWTFESSVRGEFTNEVADSTVQDGAVVFRIRSTDAVGREQTLIVRHDGPRLYLGPNAESLSLLADFGLEEGESRTVEMAGGVATTTLVARHDELDVFGTSFRDVVKVELAREGAGTQTHFFARGIGLVANESDAPPSRVRLVRATVGGEAVGTPP